MNETSAKALSLRLLCAGLIAFFAGLTAAAFAESYQYDAAGRLSTVVYDTGKEISFIYDANGNLLNRTVADSSTVGDGIAANSLASAWVDFSYTGVESGTQAQPFDTLNEGVIALLSSGTLHVVGGTTIETPSLSKRMTIQAEGGKVTIGLAP